MPCRDSRDDYNDADYSARIQLQTRCDLLASLLCELCSKTEKLSVFKETSPGLQAWWETHKAEDLVRAKRRKDVRP
jgi:hypothetical protein